LHSCIPPLILSFKKFRFETKVKMNLIQNENSRIEIIDAFRGIAVMGVLIFHYFYRFSPPYSEINYYPYQYTPIWVTKYGYYGVQFFFVISGFVISRTLEKCTSFSVFITKRIIRLLPCLIICSAITFTIEAFSGGLNNPLTRSSYLNFLPSLTFTSPDLWNSIFSTNKISYIDGVYWSLSVEMQFYIIVGLLFFWNRTKILFNWVTITSVLTILRVISSPKLHWLFPESLNNKLDSVYSTYMYLNLSYYIYFALGILFYKLYSKTENISHKLISMISIVGILELYFLRDNYLRILYITIITLFLLLIYREHWLFLLRNRIILWIGAISYPIYLLHEDIGLIIMNEIANFWNIPLLVKLTPLIAISCIFSISHLMTKYFETPIIKYFKTKIKA